MTEQIKSLTNQTIQRLNTETSPYFKPFKYAGGIMLIVSASIKIAAFFSPAMPAAVIALSADLLQIGLPLFGVSALTNKKGAEVETKGFLNIVKQLIK